MVPLIKGSLIAFSLIFTASSAESYGEPSTTVPCITADQACAVSNGQFIQSMANVTSEEECTHLCSSNSNCSHATHFPDSAFPFSNICMIFSSCSLRQDLSLIHI